MRELRLRDMGPIHDVDVALGDLTVLVGPQASGKSLFLQTVKLVEDLDGVVVTHKKHGFHWEKEKTDFLELVYGEGMGALYSGGCEVTVDGEPWDLWKELDRSEHKKGKRRERLFYVPAQRVLTIQEGWPRPFTAYEVGAPYVVKQFSEELRLLLESGLGGSGEVVFPQSRRWKKELRDVVSDSIFHDAEVQIDRSRVRKRIILSAGGSKLPFMSWSAGQREFIPLMLGLYWLMPTQGSGTRQGRTLAVIEEPEMGLHPRAISTMYLAVLDLLRRGYKVLISTHAPHVLELTWAINHLKALSSTRERLLELFGLPPRSRSFGPVADSILKEKELRVYYFNHTSSGVVSKDITRLDPDSTDLDEADWGGLTELASRSAEVVTAASAEALR